MGIRYQAYFKNRDGIRYRIDILDDNLASDVAEEIKMAENGFSIRYEGDTSDITKGILPSSCSVGIIISNASIETFITDIANAVEERFFLRIMKQTGTFKLFWIGFIVPDLSTFDDSNYPFVFNFNAIDGLSRLKDFTYVPVLNYRFIDIFIAIFSRLKTTQFWNVTDIFLSTAINWFASPMFSGAPASSLDPLLLTRVNQNSYTYLDSGERIYHNCYDVLIQLLLQWNARIYLNNGQFFIVQINQLINDTISIHSYSKSGTFISDTSAFQLTVSGFRNMGQYTFLRPVKTVNLLNDYRLNIFITDRLALYYVYNSIINVGMFSASNAEILNISGIVNITLTDTGSTVQNNKLHFRMQMKIGNYYLENPGGVYSWTTNSAALVNLYSATFGDYNYVTTLNFSIQNSPIPEMGVGEFSFNFLGIEDDAGNIIVPLPSTLNIAISYSNFSLKQTGTDGKQSYSASSALTGTHFQKKLVDLLTGDGPSSDAVGKLEILDTSGAWVESREYWTVNGVGTPTWINQLLTTNILALQSTARRRYSGTIAGVELFAYQTVIINNVKFALMSGVFDAANNEWKADWHEIKEN